MGGDSGADLKGLVVLVILHSLLLIIFSQCSFVILHEKIYLKLCNYAYC